MLMLRHSAWCVWTKRCKISSSLNVSLCLIILNTRLPALLQPHGLPGLSRCPNISGSRPQVWRGVPGVSLGGLGSWHHARVVSTAERGPPSRQLPPYNDQQARQETGSRKKKAGHPVHLDQCVKHDITDASLVNEKYQIWGRKKRKENAVALLLTHLSSHTFLSTFLLCVCLCVCVCVLFSLCLSVHLFSQFAFSALTLTPFSRLLHHRRHQILPSSVREERRKRNTRSFIWIYTSNTLTQFRQKKNKSTNIVMRKQTETRHKLEHTHTNTPPRHTAHTDRQTHKETANTKHSAARSLLYAEIF